MADRDELAESISQVDVDEHNDDYVEDSHDEPEQIESQEAEPEAKDEAPDPLAEMNRKIDGLTKALTSERTARQIAEAQAKALKEASASQADEQKEPEFDPFADNAAEQMRAMIARETGAVRQELQQRFISMSERAARVAHPDYDDRVADLQDMAQTEPARAQAILQAAQRSDDPAEYVYQEVIRAKADPVSLQQQVAELQEKLAALESGAPSTKPTATPTLSRNRDAGGHSAKGVTSLDDFLAKNCP